MQLQVALHEKDMKLTDIRLEALSSAHQLEQLRETMNRMKVGGHHLLEGGEGVLDGNRDATFPTFFKK